VYPVSYGDDWKRRDIKIGDGTLTLKCKLWDEFAEKDVRVGSQISFTNVTVNEYRGLKTVSSSDDTELSVIILYYRPVGFLIGILVTVHVFIYL